MKPKVFIVLLLFCLSLLLVPAWAEENTTLMSAKDSLLIPTLEKGGKGGFFNLEVTDNLINLKANQASFKKILKDLEKKAGIKVNIP